MKHPFALAASLLLTLPANAAASSEKRVYSLTNPTPGHLLRDLSTDRPDKTESPYTVDAGRFQVEADIVSYVRDREGGGDTRTTAWAYSTLNLKAGLRHDLDVQLVLETYSRVRTEDNASGLTDRRSGYGDTTVRVKWNMWGNDGGPDALAVLPYVKLPTNQDGLGNNHVEGGVVFPYAKELPGGWGLGIMPGVEYVRSDSGGRHASFLGTITVGHAIVGDLSGFVEFFGEISSEPGARWVGTVDFGVTYAVGRHIQLDAGVNVGVTRSADDLNIFLGVTRRF